MILNICFPFPPQQFTHACQQSSHKSYYNARSLFVRLSAPYSAFPVAQSRTRPRRLSPWALSTFPPPWPHGQLEAAGVELPGFFPCWLCQVRQYSAQLRGDIWWMRRLKGPSLRPVSYYRTATLKCLSPEDLYRYRVFPPIIDWPPPLQTLSPMTNSLPSNAALWTLIKKELYYSIIFVCDHHHHHHHRLTLPSISKSLRCVPAHAGNWISGAFCTLLRPRTTYCVQALPNSWVHSFH